MRTSLDYEPTRRLRLLAMNARPRAGLSSIILHSVLIVLSLLTLIPFFWLLCATFKTKADFFKSTFLPDNLGNLTLGNYTSLFREQPFAGWMVNSIFLASAHTVLVVALSSLGGFALAKYRFAGRKLLMLMMLVTMLVPSQVLLLPNYELMRQWNWMNSYAAILVPSAVSVFGMFLFRQAMQSVPDELMQAGRMDGCSEVRLWWEGALPIVRPMIRAYTLLSFMSAWNSFLWPQIILQTPEKMTLPLGLANMMSLPEYQTNLGILMAANLTELV